MSVRLRAFLMRNVMVQNEKELVLKELFYSTLICVSLSYFLLFFFSFMLFETRQTLPGIRDR